MTNVTTGSTIRIGGVDHTVEDVYHSGLIKARAGRQIRFVTDGEYELPGGQKTSVHDAVRTLAVEVEALRAKIEAMEGSE